MEVEWLWFSFVVDPLLIVFFSIGGIFAGKIGTEKNKEILSRVSEYMLKAVAITAAAVGLASFPQVFSAGPNGESMILLAFCTLVLGAGLGSWSNIDVKLEKLVNDKFDEARDSKKSRLALWMESIDRSKFETGRTFGWAAAYATYVSLVGVLSIMGPIHESIDGIVTFIIVKCVLDSVASFVFAMNWGSGVIFSSIPVFIFQFIVGFLAPFIKGTFSGPVISFMDAVGGVIIMAMGLSVSGMLKSNDGNSFRTGNFFPAMVLSWIVGNIAVALNFFW